MGQEPWLPCRKPGRPPLSGEKPINFESSQGRNLSGLQRPRERQPRGLASALGLCRQLCPRPVGHKATGTSNAQPQLFRVSDKRWGLQTQREWAWGRQAVRQAGVRRPEFSALMGQRGPECCLTPTLYVFTKPGKAGMLPCQEATGTAQGLKLGQVGFGVARCQSHW